jgi:hypothetical protein
MAKITLEELQEMFAELREEGEWNLDEPLPWGYFFTSHEQEKLEKAGDALTEQGYTVVGIFDAEDSMFLHVEKTEKHTPESMLARNEELNAFAEKFGLESYEGMDLTSEVESDFDEEEETVENPELLAALEALDEEPTTEQRETLTEELQSAMFLIPVANDQDLEEATDGDEGAINLVICTDDEGAEFMPLFTDEASLRAWTDEPVAAVPMSAAEAWEFILAQEDCAGAVINPGGASFPLDREMLTFLRDAD